MPFPGMLTGETTVSAPSGTPADGKAIVATSAAVNGVVPTEWRSLSVDLSGYLEAANNLSDVANAATARSNLGALGGSLGSTDNRILRSDGTGGATAQGSAVTIDDNADMSGVRYSYATVFAYDSGFTYYLALQTGLAILNSVRFGSTGPGFTLGSGSGNITITDNATPSGSVSLVWGNQTTSYPALKRSSTTLQCRLGDDSADAPFSCSNLTASGTGTFGSVSIGGNLLYPDTHLYFRAGATSASFILQGPLGANVSATNGVRWQGRGSIFLTNTSEFSFRDWLDTADAAVKCGNLTASGTVTVGASTFAALPSASANTGAILRVTDRGQKLVHSDGTDWRFVHDNTIAS